MSIVQFSNSFTKLFTSVFIVLQFVYRWWWRLLVKAWTALSSALKNRPGFQNETLISWPTLGFVVLNPVVIGKSLTKNYLNCCLFLTQVRDSLQYLSLRSTFALNYNTLQWTQKKQQQQQQQNLRTKGPQNVKALNMPMINLNRVVFFSFHRVWKIFTYLHWH